MRFALTCLCLTGLTAGCGESDDSPDPEGPPAPPAGDTYVAGLEKLGADGVLKVRLVDALPAPPDRGDNTWTLEVLDMGDSPIDGCSVRLDPRMPAHGHGTNKDAEVTAMDGGRYMAEPVDLFMPGLWVTSINLECGEMTDTVIYEFWIEG